MMMFQVKHNIALFIAIIIGSIGERTTDALTCTECGPNTRSLKRTTVGNFAEEWETFQQTCSNVLFSLSLFMSDHVYLIASAVTGKDNGKYSPKIEEMCGSMQPVFHHNGPLGKDVFFLPASDSSSMDSRLYLGDYELHELVAAFDNTNDDPSQGVPYDLVKNNCATFTLEFVQALKLQFDQTAVVQYAVDHLTQHEKITAAMKESPHFAELLEAGGIEAEDATNEVLMHLLVTKYIAEHFRN